MAKGTFTLYKGKGKQSGKSFRALLLNAGTFTKLIFIDGDNSQIVLDYLEHDYGLDVSQSSLLRAVEKSSQPANTTDTSLADEVFGNN